MPTETLVTWQPQSITPVDPSLKATLRARVDGKAKPLGSLGRIEDLAIELALMRHPQPPRADNAVLMVFAGDHGLTAEGVSQYPSAVTVAMVMTYLAGKATANAFAAANHVDVRVIDAGVAAELPKHPDLIDAKVRMGTANAARQPAMSIAESCQALDRGAELARAEIAAGADVIALGEMGIGNTASSSLLLHRLGPAPLDQSIGIGAGQDADGMVKKKAAIEKAAMRSAATAPLEVLAEFGGLEIAMMAGAVLGAAAQRRPVIVDGFIATAAALVAVRLAPEARDYCVFAHRSAERGHDLALQAMDAAPLLDLRLRLGEGTGAILAVPLLRAASRLLTDVADLSDVLAGKL
ncbi:nicotinate-nucleotide-dimethylbenzimidazole phosphoribosyltransferase [Rhodopseudomonas thermotolerans]|uniref:Nicotinate-nucleotide--dimethylbenzimidazole phosphoribosyltransferase n=2 Tax=Rhodopseudomonas TaxID=1073 RepID=A0A336JMZ9_9BRAD|nr:MULTISPECIES: nicotinate-nucleotide--dimethylbenzimidazole phosphoribosyltransferase [Rhodopseudomonas]RED38403.1 nicotinate-nucleotide-dimethylbenzimidazole phosphoribosyltransferase [Rhodopseudomonas pentothenatexigens]REG05988.1 nicotinate-nucleotide-dimethylbenzimidazole phosphoribosyltransferase [Rhodopseudomonas thermotolerans]SSW89856.1 nicotinate-nucleotide-dimethylbenzimidazole phosphoribosyltransferase [Rhodopseudomonas pentothenatexigens]